MGVEARDRYHAVGEQMLSSRQIEAPGDHTKPTTEYYRLSLVQQVKILIDQGPQFLLSGQIGRRTAGQQPKQITQSR